MTLIASWIGVDSRKSSSVYIVSDSRISWGDTANFDYGRKVFGCKNSPDIFGYCGDVLFPSIVLNQLVEIADQGLLFKSEWNCSEKFKAVHEKLTEIFNLYPSAVKGITKDILQIIHASRDNEQNFHCQIYEWQRKTGKWESIPTNIKDHSDKLIVLGSGQNEFLEKYKLYWESANKKTSRAIFHCFTDTLADIKDKYCGGAPQLVGLYKIDNAKFFGIIQNNKRYLHGLQVDNLFNLNNVDWRNELFEICDGETMKRKDNAQRQPNPLLH